MSYLVLARKYRPSTFADLVGQEHVTQTLRNAIATGRVAHAFLFTGARGVGKTTIARILAKALNCLNRTDASAEPCLTCAACTEIALGRDPDVLEIDGASNNGVESIRTLQESLPYRPQRDRFKVVIIDEVHMVTPQAFNAMLKTLEEPPPHVKFIFATTEAHKVMATILSRCQRYDFRLIPTQKIRERISSILTAEGIAYDDAAVALVAREAAGSLRDALSLLDQVIAGIEGALTEADTARLLGVAARKVLYDLMRAVLAGDAVAALHTLETISREGYDLINVAKGAQGVARDLVVARVVPNPGELLDLADDERTEVQSIAAGADPVDLERLFLAWSRAVDDVARAREPLWVLEMATVRLCHRPALLPVDELLARLGELERRLGAGGAAPDPTRPSPPRPSVPSGGGTAGGSAPRPPAQTPGSAPGPRFTGLQRPGGDPPRSQAEVAPVVSITGAGAAAVAAPQGDSWLGRALPRTPEPRVVSVAPPAPVVAVTLVDVSSVAESMPAWQQLVAAVEGNLVPVLKVAVPLTVGASLVRLAVDNRDSYFKKRLATAEAQQMIADAAERVFGARPAIDLVFGTLPDGVYTIARMEEATRTEERGRREAVAKSHPLVKAVVEVLGGEIGRVRLEGDPT